MNRNNINQQNNYLAQKLFFAICQLEQRKTKLLKYANNINLKDNLIFVSLMSFQNKWSLPMIKMFKNYFK